MRLGTAGVGSLSVTAVMRLGTAGLGSLIRASGHASGYCGCGWPYLCLRS